jgi:hypothetical protein
VLSGKGVFYVSMGHHSSFFKNLAGMERGFLIESPTIHFPTR